MYTINYNIELSDFKEFNNKIAIKSTEKSKKKAKLMGIIEIIFSFIYMSSSLINGNFKFDGFFILSIILLLMGIFSLSYYSIFFTKKLDKAISKIYNENDYFKSNLSLKFYDDFCVEIVENLKEELNLEENKKQYNYFVDIDETENIIALLWSQTSGFIIPKRCIDKQNYEEFVQFLYSKITKQKI